MFIFSKKSRWIQLPPPPDSSGHGAVSADRCLSAVRAGPARPGAAAAELLAAAGHVSLGIPPTRRAEVGEEVNATSKPGPVMVFLVVDSG